MAAPASRPGQGVVADRIVLTLIGVIAGLATWLMVEKLPDLVRNERVLLFVIAEMAGFFSAFLLATGPLRFGRAALAAAIVSLPAAGLLTWASFRYATIDGYLGTVLPLVAYALILLISLPFLIAAQQEDEGWRNYAALFTQSWSIVVRAAAAWMFVGAFWAVLYLSDALFNLVGLHTIQELIEVEAVPYALTGAVLGLALAVVVELSDYLSPFLILRLLRLLLPVVLIVSVVFLAALPVRGLSHLFGGLSAAATLMAMAIGIATLIASALDRGDDDAVEAGLLRIATQLLALAMPVLGALAVYAVWLRVAAYGMSPDRIAAGLAALVTLGYGVLYALAVLLRRAWMRRIRSANTVMALVVIALSVLWLTPVLNAERLSARNQVARYETGQVGAAQLDLWFIRHELGRAGPGAVAELAALDRPDADVLRARIVRLDRSVSEFAFLNEGLSVQAIEEADRLLRDLVVLPSGTALPPNAFAGVPSFELANWARGCGQKTPAGRPGCVLVLADLLKTRSGNEAVIFWMSGPDTAEIGVVWPGEPVPAPADQAVFLSGARVLNLTPAALDALQSGDYALEPVEVPSLSLGGARIVLQP
jgi:hypothetical protein